MKTKHNHKEGAILAVVLIIMLLLSILILSLFNLGQHSARETVYEMKSAQAFWLAEAGVQQSLDDLKTSGRFSRNDMPATTLGEGTYAVTAVDSANTNFISTGTVMMGGKPVVRKIQYNVDYAFPGYDFAVDSEGEDSPDWDFILSGMQDGDSDGPVDPGYDGGYHDGGNDVITGMIDINGRVQLFDESGVKDLSADIQGDVASRYLNDESKIEGSYTPTSAFDYDSPNLADMDYENTSDYNIAELFATNGISSGRLPQGMYVDENGVDLHDIVVMNDSPDNEHLSTSGDDYFFHPANGSEYSYDGRGTGGGMGTGDLNLGDNKTYYVDGHVWFHSDNLHHFRIDGQAVIVSSYDVHISEDLTYKDNERDEDESDLLALVALGQELDVNGRPGSHGDIFFGDPKYGYTYEVEGFMFANNNFHYNVDALDPDNPDELAEPKCGFSVFGNFMAMNQVVVNRDWYDEEPANGETATWRQSRRNRWRTAEFINGGWYDTSSGDAIDDNYVSYDGERRPAVQVYDDSSGTWVWEDTLTGEILSAWELSSRRHYAMQVVYDDRIRDFAARLTGLPVGDGTIVIGISGWEEIAP